MAKRYLSTNPSLERMEKAEDRLSFYDGRGARIGTYNPQTEGSAEQVITRLNCAYEGGYLTRPKCAQYTNIIQRKEALAKKAREANSGFEKMIGQLENIRKTAEEKRAG